MAYRLAIANNAPLRLVMPPVILRIFTLTGIDGLLAIYPTLNAALTATPAPRGAAR